MRAGRGARGEGEDEAGPLKLQQTFEVESESDENDDDGVEAPEPAGANIAMRSGTEHGHNRRAA